MGLITETNEQYYAGSQRFLVSGGFTPITDANIQEVVDLWISDPSSSANPYGPISTWDVSLVTDMSDLFKYKTTFNDDISNWDVSNVTDMNRMFLDANSFNQDIGSWDVSNVTNMFQMFANAQSFNQDISTWNVSSVTDMSGMFYVAVDFNQDLSGWDVSNVTNYNNFAGGATSWVLPQPNFI